MKFNVTVNLISSKTAPTADLVHFADSIFGLETLEKLSSLDNAVHDIGSGNGFPGVVFSILAPQQKFVCIDSDTRKCEFLKHCAQVLKLSNLSVQNTPVEKLAESSIRFGVSRGFANLSKSILLCRRPFAVGGSYYHMKSDEWSGEVAAIPTQLCAFWTPSLIGDYLLPGTTHRYFVVKTEKIQA